MNAALDSVLHDALAQSERSHTLLEAPSIRGAIARRRVVRRAAVASVATASAAGLGIGSYAIFPGLFRSNEAAVGGPSASGLMLTSPSPQTMESPSPTASIVPPLPTVQPSPTVATTPGFASPAEFCQNVPVMVAQSEAAGTSITDVTASVSLLPLKSIECGLPDHYAVVRYNWGNSSGMIEGYLTCDYFDGPLDFKAVSDGVPGGVQRRWADMCLDGVHMQTFESIKSGTFPLTDEDFQKWATASLPLASEAQSFAP